MAHSDDQSKPDDLRRQPGDDEVPVTVFRSADLFAGQQEVLIEHAGGVYRLRITRSGKLILQK